MNFLEFKAKTIEASIQEFGAGQAFEQELGVATESSYIVKDVGLSEHEAANLSCAVEVLLDTCASGLPIDFTFKDMQRAMNIV